MLNACGVLRFFASKLAPTEGGVTATCAAPLHPAYCASTPRPLPACLPGTGCPRSVPSASRCVSVGSARWPLRAVMLNLSVTSCSPIT
ncbi:hypothetical protein FIV41_21505 [Pseudomonas marginalis]|uniref:Uncharacterized protein n=1 Tax=Pseudomonas marginalis TaxID=298 RepID=A0A9X9BPX2_PSEMA|nr:hypothetical protein FIV41_21505 [Pseudomonas marginalis]